MSAIYWTFLKTYKLAYFLLALVSYNLFVNSKKKTKKTINTKPLGQETSELA